MIFTGLQCILEVTVTLTERANRREMRNDEIGRFCFTSLEKASAYVRKDVKSYLQTNKPIEVLKGYDSVTVRIYENKKYYEPFTELEYKFKTIVLH